MAVNDIVMSAAGAAGNVYFINNIGATGTTEGYSKTALDSTGNIYCAGYDSTTGNDFLFTKYNSSGVIQWQKTLGAASGSFIAYGIVIDSSDNIYVCGNDSNSKGLLTKYNTSGTLQWQREYPLTSQFIKVAVDSSGNVFVTGQYTAAGPNVQGLTVQFNSSGTLQTIQKVLAGSSSENFYDIAFDSSGNFYCAGRTNTPTVVGGFDCLLAKYNSAGTLQAQVRIGGGTGDAFNGIAIDSSNNIYCVGSIGSGCIIVKYNTSGVVQWQKTLTGASSDIILQSVATDSSGNIYCVGYNQSPSEYSGVILKYNSSGTLQWQRNFTKPLNHIVFSGIKIDTAGNMYISGSEIIIATFQYNGLLLKLPTDGSLTGTYGTYTYSASSFTDSTASYTTGVTTLTDTNLSQTATTSTFTAGTASYTSTTITI